MRRNRRPDIREPDYPVFLKIAGKKAVVVGGGNVAERKVLSLLEAGAEVTVVSPEVTKRLSVLALSKKINHIPRLYRRGDLRGAFISIAATNSADANRKISKEAPFLVNVADSPSDCGFIVPSVVRRGPLSIAISTSGSSPALAASIRKELEDSYGKDFARYLKFLSGVRKKALVEVCDEAARRRLLKYAASAELLAEFRLKGLKTVQKLVREKFTACAKKHI